MFDDGMCLPGHGRPAMAYRLCSDGCVEHFDTEVALEELGNYLAGLGKQTVTVGLSAIEDDMVEEYRQMVEGLQLFSCSPHERLFIREFLSTRECFHFVEHRLPYVEATFHPNTVGQELAVEIHFKKVLPLLHFQDLRNVVGEGDWYSLKPRLVREARAAVCWPFADLWYSLYQHRDWSSPLTTSSDPSKKHGFPGSKTSNPSEARSHNDEQPTRALVDWTPTPSR